MRVSKTDNTRKDPIAKRDQVMKPEAEALSPGSGTDMSVVTGAEEFNQMSSHSKIRLHLGILA